MKIGNIQLKMSKIIVLQMRNELPNERRLAFNYHRSNCFLCQTFHFPPQLRQINEDKLNTLLLLTSNSFAKIEAIIKQDHQIHLIYECVQNKLVSVLEHSSFLFINGIYGQLKLLQHYLTNFRILINFNVHRFGIDEMGNLKYFLDLDFTFNPQIPKFELTNFYNQQILALLKYFCRINTQISEHEKIQLYNQMHTHPSPKSTAAQQKTFGQFFEKITAEQLGWNHPSSSIIDSSVKSKGESSYGDLSEQSCLEASVQENAEDLEQNFEMGQHNIGKKVMGLSELSALQIQQLVQREIDRTKRVAQELHNLYRIQQ